MLADWIGAGVDPERSIVFRQSQVPEHAGARAAARDDHAEVVARARADLQGSDRRAGRADRHLRVLRLSGAADRRHRALPRDAACRWARTSSRTWSWRARSCAASTISTETEKRGCCPSRRHCLPKRRSCSGSTIARCRRATATRSSSAPIRRRSASMVGRMITDPLKQRRGDPGRPEICNVFSYEKLFGTPAERVAEIDRTCRSGELGCREHKDEIAERIVEYLRPFRERREAGAGRPGRAGAAARPRRRPCARDGRAEHAAAKEAMGL